MLPQALGAPARSHDAVGTLLIGGTLLLFSVLFPLIWLFALVVSPVWIILAPLAVFPPLLTLGYDLRVLEAGLREEPATPPFLDWSELVRDGIRSILLGVVYLLPALVVVGAASGIVATLQTGQLPVSELVTDVATGVSTAGAGTFLALYVGVFLYVRPATLAIFAATGRMRAALSPRRVFRVATSADYALGWAVAAAVLFVGLLIATPLGLLLVGFLLAFYVRAVAYYVYGFGARTRVAVPGESATADDESPAITVRTTSPATTSDQAATATGRRADRSRTRATLGVAWSPRAAAEAPADVQVGRTVGSPTVNRESRDTAGTASDDSHDDTGPRSRGGLSTDARNESETDARDESTSNSRGESETGARSGLPD
jgi:hypothetical protein